MKKSKKKKDYLDYGYNAEMWGVRSRHSSLKQEKNLNSLNTNNLSWANNPKICRGSRVHRALLISAYPEQ